MSTTTASRVISAPLDVVFQIVAHIDAFKGAIPHIVDVEFLTEKRVGVGTRFRETRLMKGKRASTELEVTEYEENQRVRLVSDTHGTVWDTIFTLREDGPHTHLEMKMEARPHQLMAKLITPLIKGAVQKAVEADMDAVKSHCEALAQA